MYSDEAYNRADKARRALLTALIEDALLLKDGWYDAQTVLDQIGVSGVDALKLQDMSHDSLELLNIIVTIEEDLNVDLDDARIEKFMLEEATIGSVLPIITDAMGGQNA